MRILLAALSTAVLAGPAFGDGLEVQPGEWQNETTVTMNMVMNGQTVPMPPQTQSTTECIAPEEARFDPADLTDETCTVGDVVNTGNTMSFALSCQQEGMTLAGQMELTRNDAGTEIDGTFKLNGGQPGVVDIDVTANVTGKRIGDC